MSISGYIYAIEDESQRIKLGMAENVDKRRNELQTGNAEVLTVLFLYPVKNMKKAEDALHDLFAAGRIRPNSEWFVIHDTKLLYKIFGVIDISDREKALLESLGLR